MKCSIKLHFIWVFTVCQSTCLGVSVYKGLKHSEDELGVIWVLIWFWQWIAVLLQTAQIMKTCLKGLYRKLLTHYMVDIFMYYTPSLFYLINLQEYGY